ncbi:MULTISPECIES: hypothetical protein [unclassified Moraxella]|uniref:hypothetical protein n=1 Tax=unclassified Moraxella TaxID=2685852 RepID=UPI00359E52C0
MTKRLRVRCKVRPAKLQTHRLRHATSQKQLAIKRRCRRLWRFACTKVMLSLRVQAIENKSKTTNKEP